MNLLARIHLGPRLGGAFLLMVALLVSCVAFSIARLSAQNSNMDRVVRSEVGALLALVRLETQAQAVGVSLRDSILSDRGDVIKAALANVTKLIGEIAATTTELESLASSDRRRDVEQIKNTQRPFLAALNKVADSARRGDNDGAREQLISDSFNNPRKAYTDAVGSRPGAAAPPYGFFSVRSRVVLRMGSTARSLGLPARSFTSMSRRRHRTRTGNPPVSSRTASPISPS